MHRYSLLLLITRLQLGRILLQVTHSFLQNFFFPNPSEDQRTAVNDRWRASREFFHCLCIWTTSPSRSGSIRHREVRDWGSGLCISTRLWCLSGPINLVSLSAVLACTLIDYHQACFAISSIAESSHARAFTRVQSNDLRCLMVTVDWLPQEGWAPPGVTGVVVWIVLRVAENYLSSCNLDNPVNLFFHVHKINVKMFSRQPLSWMCWDNGAIVSKR